MTLLLLLFLLGQEPREPTGVAAPDPVAVYAAVLAHIRRVDASGTHPIALNRSVMVDCMRGCDHDAAPQHTPEVLEHLRESGLVTAIFRPQDGLGSRIGVPHVRVRLGPVLELPGDARVKILPEERQPGIPLDRQLAAVPDSAAVPVDLAVDAVVTTPCPAPSGSERCRVPDTLRHRYFLRAGPNGEAVVLTRWLTGAISQH